MEQNDEYLPNSMSDMFKAMLQKDKLEIPSKGIETLPIVSADEIVDILLDNNQSSFDKAQLTELLVAYIISELKKDYDLKSDCQTPKIIFENSTKATTAGSYSADKNNIVLPNNFAVWPSHIIHNITTLAHELRHFAQHNGTKEGNDFPSAIPTNHNNLQMAIIFSNLGNLRTVHNTPFSKRIDLQGYLNSHETQYKTLFYHDNLDYFLNPAEMDARQFEVNIGLDLLENINSRQDINQNLIDMYLEQLNEILSNEEEALYYAEALNDKYIDLFKKNVQTFRENIFKQEPDFFENYANEPWQYPIYLFPALCESICVNYDDKIAHQLIQSIISAKNINNNIKLKSEFDAIVHMIIESDIELNFKEKYNLAQFCDRPKTIFRLLEIQQEFRQRKDFAKEYER